MVASMYAVYHGPAGLKRIAERVAAYTAILAEGLRRLGCTVRGESAFDTLTVDTGAGTAAIARRALDAGMNLRRFPEWGDTMLGIALDETTTRDDIVALWRVFANDGQALPDLAAFERGIAPLIPEGLRRTTPFLTHPVFNRHHSETEMLRYLRSLADKDLALDRSMIPLGSCTMKLNAIERDDSDHLARVRAHPSVRARRPARRLRDAQPPARGVALRGDRLRRRQPAAERRLAGRVRRAARDPRLARIARRRGAHGLPDPRVGARHEPGERADGGPAASSSPSATPKATSTSPTWKRSASSTPTRSRA